MPRSTLRRQLSSLLGSRLVLLGGTAGFLAGFFLLLVAQRSDGRSVGSSLGMLVLGVVLAAAAFAAVAVVAGRGARDIAANRLLARELEASEQLFGRILEIAADAIISIDEDQRILHYNKGAEEIFGWRAEEVLGKPLSLLIPERFHAAHRRHIQEFRHASQSSRRMGERQEIFGLRRDGSEFPAEASISRLELPDRVVFTVVLRDISQRKRVEEDERFLSRASVTLSATLDFESTLRSAVHVAIPYLADCCVLDVADPGPGLRRIVSVHEDAQITKRLKALETSRVESGHWPFPVTAAMARGVPIVRQDLEDGWAREGGPGGEIEQLVSSLGIRAMMTVPLAARGHTIGALTLLATEPGRSFSDDRRNVAVSLANVIALSIENAALYRAAQRATVARDEILGVVSHDLRNPLSAINDVCTGALGVPARRRSSPARAAFCRLGIVSHDATPDTGSSGCRGDRIRSPYHSPAARVARAYRSAGRGHGASSCRRQEDRTDDERTGEYATAGRRCDAYRAGPGEPFGQRYQIHRSWR